MKRKNPIIKILIAVIVAVAIVVIVCNVVVMVASNGRCYDEVADIPQNEYGLLLGTSPITRQGGHNYYFDTRIRAAAELYHAHRINRIIASGGDYTGNGGYDEPIAMRDSLVGRNVPDSAIVLDYQGLRTLNSIERAKNDFGLDSITLISQSYHNGRALLLAKHCGINAVAYNADTPPSIRKKIKNFSRECLARVKMFIDLLRG